MDLLKLAQSKQEEMVKDLCDLLKIKSVTDMSTSKQNAPFGEGIKDCLEHFLEMAKKDGFNTLNDEGYAGVVEYGTSEDLVGILCHLDVVPAGGVWKYPPFSATIEDGKIYARGAMDDKGPTIAAYYALKIIKELGIKLNKKIQIILGTDEETGWRGIDHYSQKYQMPKLGFAPDADFPLIYGEKGIFNAFLVGDLNDEIISIEAGERFNVVIDEATVILKNNHQDKFNEYLTNDNLKGTFKELTNGYEYKVFGVSAHAMEPFKGINAGTHLLSFLNTVLESPFISFIANNLHNEHFLKKLNLDLYHEEMKELTCNIGIIKIENQKLVVSLDIRYPIGFEENTFVNQMNEKLNKAAQIVVVQNKAPHYVPRNSQLVETLYNVYKEFTGDEVNEPKTIGGGTYARALKEGVAFGMELPNQESVVHQPNEYVEINTLVKATAIYAKAILKLGGYDA